MSDARTYPNPPRTFDLNDPKEIERLLDELSGFLAQDKKMCRKAFLRDGTDSEGRKFALEALDAWHWKRYLESKEKRLVP